MGANFELFAALLVDVRRAVNGEFLQPRRQRNGPANLRARPFGRAHDLSRRGIEDTMIERLEPDANILTVHDRLSFFENPWWRYETAASLTQ